MKDAILSLLKLFGGNERLALHCIALLVFKSLGPARSKKGRFLKNQVNDTFFVELINKLQPDRWGFNLRAGLDKQPSLRSPNTAHGLHRRLPDCELNLCPADWPFPVARAQPTLRMSSHTSEL